MKKLVLKLYSGLKELPYWHKYVMTFKNWTTYLWDWLGFIKKDEIVTYRLRDGIQFQVRTGTTDRIVINNIYIKNAFIVSRSDARRCSIVIDIGAHIGVFSIFMASLAEVKVYAYEPEPSNYELLVENIRLNRLEDRVFPFKQAVSNSKGIIRLHVTPNQTMAHSTVTPSSESIEAPCLTLGDIFSDNHIQKCDLLKINAEGAEYPILLNTTERTLSRIRTICVQCHMSSATIDKKHNISVLEKFLVENGFRVIRKGEFIKAMKG